MASVTGNVDIERIAAVMMPSGCVRRPRPFRAPLVEGDQHGNQFGSLVGEMVFVTRRVLGIHSALDNLVIFELAESVRKDVPRCARVGSDLIEAVHAVDEFADRDQRPALSDDV